MLSPLCFHLELESLHGRLSLLKYVLLLAEVHLWGDAGVLVLRAKVMLDQVECLLIDLLVFVALKKLDFVQTWRWETSTGVTALLRIQAL